MNQILIFLLLTLATWLLRIGLVVLFPASRLPSRLRATLEHLGPAAFAAILVLDLTKAVTATSNTLTSVETLIAAAIIAGVAYRTRNRLLPAVIAVFSVVLLDMPW
jgi:branched-subunit amino acid transport protein